MRVKRKETAAEREVVKCTQCTAKNDVVIYYLFILLVKLHISLSIKTNYFDIYIIFNISKWNENNPFLSVHQQQINCLVVGVNLWISPWVMVSHSSFFFFFTSAPLERKEKPDKIFSNFPIILLLALRGPALLLLFIHMVDSWPFVIGKLIRNGWWIWIYLP